MVKGFASVTDTTKKKDAFFEVGADLYFFTAEGESNSAVIPVTTVISSSPHR